MQEQLARDAAAIRLRLVALVFCEIQVRKANLNNSPFGYDAGGELPSSNG
jgi:hypothetical protein